LAGPGRGASPRPPALLGGRGTGREERRRMACPSEAGRMSAFADGWWDGYGGQARLHWVGVELRRARSRNAESAVAPGESTGQEERRRMERATGFEPATSTLGTSLKGSKQRSRVKFYVVQGMLGSKINPVCHHGVTTPGRGDVRLGAVVRVAPPLRLPRGPSPRLLPSMPPPGAPAEGGVFFAGAGGPGDPRPSRASRPSLGTRPFRDDDNFPGRISSSRSRRPQGDAE
jgi:hypothetical protein